MHALTARILQSIGAVTVLGQALVACGDDNPDDGFGCPETTNEEVTPAPGCTITISSEEFTDELCVAVPLTNGECPAFDDPIVGQTASDSGQYYMRIACGPLRPAEPLGGAGEGGSGGIGEGGAGGGAAGGAAEGGAAVGGAGEGGSGGTGEGGGEGLFYGSCCYIGVDGNYCIGGRPLVVAGQARTSPSTARSDWSAAPSSANSADSLDAEASAALAKAWRSDAALEHASVAAFSRFSLELLAVGAPAELVADAHRAALDEVHHAQLCYALASRFGGAPVGPGPLDVGGVVAATTLEEVVFSAVIEGCVGETVAAMQARRALAAATDPQVIATLERIAEDEARHAELAWRFVAWAVRHGDQTTRDAFERAFVEARANLRRVPRATEAFDGRLAQFGRLSLEDQRAVAEEALAAVIEPCARAISSVTSQTATVC